MKQYSTFIFDSYTFDREHAEITLRYLLSGGPTTGDDIEFVERILLPKRGMRFTKVPPTLLDRALFALHLIGGISYYKTCCPKQLVIRSGTLTEHQATFWNTVYENGLGEFFYRNNIDFHGLITFPWEPNNDPPYIPFQTSQQRVLVPVGGGKDSTVTIELLKNAGFHPTLFRTGGHPLLRTFAKHANCPLLEVERILSPALFALNAEGALNGHIPITAYISILAVVLATLYDFSTIVMSNERSANVGSLLFHGKEINHQWSKSLACERLLQEYFRTYLTPDLQYFSLLRPWSELRIAHAFSALPHYLTSTTSCNANWKITHTEKRKGGNKKLESTWCGTCPKCAFAFALYAAFLPKENVLSTFGKNLFADATLVPLYLTLLGSEGTKPFECVGTPEETKAAFLLIRERGEFNDTPVMQAFFQRELPAIRDATHLVDRVLQSTTDHAIPPTFSTVLP